jgi:hypothetical protein
VSRCDHAETLRYTSCVGERPDFDGRGDSGEFLPPFGDLERLILTMGEVCAAVEERFNSQVANVPAGESRRAPSERLKGRRGSVLRAAPRCEARSSRRDDVAEARVVREVDDCFKS